MAARLNVVALISGGKDSLYCILHCLENGHKLVALANLYPDASSHGEDARPDGESSETPAEDINSFMYQTVGHRVIPLYAECLDLPLYRQLITGKAVQTGRYYKATGSVDNGDETEDLRPLLLKVLNDHPEANAVCTGAILSTYQRTRFESVAVSLGLTPLAYLWQYPALPPPPGRGESVTGLLDDMAAAGCDARIIKIASGGIKDALLWANVVDPRSRSMLVSGLSPFFDGHEFWLRGAVLGEGGEFETLAVDGPRSLWKKRIEVAQDHRATCSEDGGVSYVSINGANITENVIEQPDSQTILRIPSTLDAQFVAVLDRTRKEDVTVPLNAENQGQGWPSHLSTFVDIALPILKMYQSMITCHAGTPNRSGSQNGGIEQMKEIVRQLKTHFKTYDPSPEILSSVLLVRNMADFAAINAAYSALLSDYRYPNPPARLTISCPLPKGVDISLSLIFRFSQRQQGSTRGLWVQSRSYWAPANIGPYSQAICEPLQTCRDTSNINVHDAGVSEVVHMAGQIPLVPQSMQILDASFLEQALLSLQHLWRVGQERGVDLWTWGIAFLNSSNDHNGKAGEACATWRHAHLSPTRPKKDQDDTDDNEDGYDAWDLQHNHFAYSHSKPPTVGEHLHVLPDSTVFVDKAGVQSFVPPFLAASVIALPRSAPVEWWSLGIANLPKTTGRGVVDAQTKHADWGTITTVSVSHSPTNADDEYTDGATENPSFTCFVMVQLLQDALIRAPERTVWDFVSQINELSLTATNGEVIHGTVYVTAEAQKHWDALTQDTVVSHLAIIPCCSLEGTAFSSEPHSALTAGAELSRLGMALTFRVDCEIALII